MVIRHQEVKERFLCGLCDNEIKNRHEITFCPQCMNGYHTPHLASWFYTNSRFCPTCDAGFDDLIVRELTPQNEVEKWKLEVINILYNRHQGENKVSNSWIISKLRKLSSMITSPFSRDSGTVDSSK